jgi:hypothetical protein
MNAIFVTATTRGTSYTIMGVWHDIVSTKCLLFSREVTGCCRLVSGMTVQFKSNFAKVFIFATLLSALMCSEFPELTKLTDDTSNDFTTPSYVMREVTSAVAVQVTATVMTPAPRITPSRKFSAALPETRFIRNSRDLLLLCSLLRI